MTLSAQAICYVGSALSWDVVETVLSPAAFITWSTGAWSFGCWSMWANRLLPVPFSSTNTPLTSQHTAHTGESGDRECIDRSEGSGSAWW